MDKLYQRIYYENSPSKKTPVNDENLNRMDKGINDLDNRIIELNGTIEKTIENGKKDIAESVKQVTDEAQEQINNIATKGQEVLDSIPGDYQATVEQVEKNKLAIFDLDRLKASAIIQKASGNAIVINDSAKAGFPSMRTLGKSEQRKTSGKNLIGNMRGMTTYSSNGIDWTYADGVFTANGTATADSSFSLSPKDTGLLLPAGKYFLSGCPEGGYTNGVNHWYITLTPINSPSSNPYVYAYNDRVIEIVDGNSPMWVACRVKAGETVTNLQFRPQLEAGEVGTEWEPYTGGIASPNPQYPQEIVSTGQRMIDGWQLTNLPDVEETKHNGITWNCKNGAVTAKGTTEFANNSNGVGISYLMPVIAGTYTLSGGGTNLKLHALVTLADGTNQYYGSVTFNLDGTEKSCLIFCQVNAGVTANETIYPMLNVGTEAKPWEPYTGGVPAVVDMPIETEVLGKNLYNKDLYPLTLNKALQNDGSIYNAQSGNWYATVDYIPFYGLDGKDIRYGKHVDAVLAFYDIHKTCISSVKGGRATVPQNTAYIRFECHIDEIDTAQIELGTEATEWQPYAPKQSLTINKEGGFAGIPVTDASIANYTDADGQMWICDTREWERGLDVQRVDILTIGKTDRLREHTYANVYKYPLLGTASDCTYKSLIGNAALCDKYHLNVVNVSTMEHGEFRLSDYCYFKNTEVSALEELTALFEANPVRILYPLATPIETPIPEAELSAWRALHANEPATTIFSDAEVEVKYVTDTKTYIDNKFAELAAAMVAGREV